MDALNTLEVLRRNVVSAPDKGTALDLMVALKAAEELVKTLRANNLQNANTEFTNLKAANPDVKNHNLGGGILKSYSLPATWKFSSMVTGLEANVKTLKAAEKTNGTAEKILPEFDSEKNASFAISLSSKVTLPGVATA
jgi:hypothetical protein